MVQGGIEGLEIFDVKTPSGATLKLQLGQEISEDQMPSVEMKKAFQLSTISGNIFNCIKRRWIVEVGEEKKEVTNSASPSTSKDPQVQRSTVEAKEVSPGAFVAVQTTPSKTIPRESEGEFPEPPRAKADSPFPGGVVARVSTPISPKVPTVEKSGEKKGKGGKTSKN
jgi:hypothetical protein